MFGLITAIVLIAFGILQIVLFFKIWEMTNDVKKITTKFLSNNLLDEAQFEYLRGNTEEAEKLFLESFYRELMKNHNSRLTYYEKKQKDENIYSYYQSLAGKTGFKMPDKENYNQPEKFFV